MMLPLFIEVSISIGRLSVLTKADDSAKVVYGSFDWTMPCNYFKFSSTCGTQFSRLALGSVITQVVANADVGGVDGQVRSNSVCAPRTYVLTLHNCSLYATLS